MLSYLRINCWNFTNWRQQQKTHNTWMLHTYSQNVDDKCRVRQNDAGRMETKKKRCEREWTFSHKIKANIIKRVRDPFIKCIVARAWAKLIQLLLSFSLAHSYISHFWYFRRYDYENSSILYSSFQKAWISMCKILRVQWHQIYLIEISIWSNRAGNWFNSTLVSLAPF